MSLQANSEHRRIRRIKSITSTDKEKRLRLRWRNKDESSDVSILLWAEFSFWYFHFSHVSHSDSFRFKPPFHFDGSTAKFTYIYCGLCAFADTYTIIHGAFYERTWQCPLLQMYIIEFSIRLHRDNQKEIFSTIKCNLIQAHIVTQLKGTRERWREANDRNRENEKVGGKTIDE